MTAQLQCLVTGATGYIGGRLVPELLRRGHTVRAMARKPAKLGRRGSNARPPSVSSASPACGPLIRIIPIAAGGAPLDKAKIVSFIA